jgi:hypothetical protein
MSTPQGRRCLFQLSARPLLERDAFTGEELSREYNLGQQAHARWLLAVLERVDPDLFDKMMLEGLRERRTDRVHEEPDAPS